MGRLSVLECAFWGFLLSFALLHLFPLLRLFVTRFTCNGPIIVFHHFYQSIAKCGGNDFRDGFVVPFE